MAIHNASNKSKVRENFCGFSRFSMNAKVFRTNVQFSNGFLNSFQTDEAKTIKVLIWIKSNELQNFFLYG